MQLTEMQVLTAGIHPPWTSLYALIRMVIRSIYDGTTQFRVGTTVMQQSEEQYGGGLYVFSTVGAEYCAWL